MFRLVKSPSGSLTTAVGFKRVNLMKKFLNFSCLFFFFVCDIIHSDLQKLGSMSNSVSVQLFVLSNFSTKKKFHFSSHWVLVLLFSCQWCYLSQISCTLKLIRKWLNLSLALAFWLEDDIHKWSGSGSHIHSTPFSVNSNSLKQATS